MDLDEYLKWIGEEKYTAVSTYTLPPFAKDPEALYKKIETSKEKEAQEKREEREFAHDLIDLLNQAHELMQIANERDYRTYGYADPTGFTYWVEGKFDTYRGLNSCG